MKAKRLIPLIVGVIVCLCIIMFYMQNITSKTYSADYSGLSIDELSVLYVNSIKNGDAVTVSQIVDNNLYGKMSDNTPEIIWLTDAE